MLAEFSHSFTEILSICQFHIILAAVPIPPKLLSEHNFSNNNFDTRKNVINCCYSND